MPEIKRTVDTCIVIVDVNLDDALLTVGCMVDSVQAVLEMSDNEVELPPKMGMRLRTDFIQGMGKRDEKFIIILNIDKIISSDELVFMQNARAGDTDETYRSDGLSPQVSSEM